MCQFKLSSANSWFDVSRPLDTVSPDDRVADFADIAKSKLNVCFAPNIHLVS
jgi:hypothetical protein